jgi:hypothetical protein
MIAQRRLIVDFPQADLEDATYVITILGTVAGQDCI